MDMSKSIQVLDTIEKCKAEYVSTYKPFCEQMEQKRAELDAKYSMANLEITETNGKCKGNDEEKKENIT
jgi:hypothetical protein